MKARQAGLALSEVLVAMALSLLVILAAASLLHASNGDFLHNGANTRIDDNGRFALAIVTQALRQAGYPGEPGESSDQDGAGAAAPAGPLPPLAIEGRDAASVASNANELGAPLPAINGSDAIAIRYAAGALAGAGAGSAMLNCAGFPASPGEWAWSIFYVAEASDGVAELRCKYKGPHGWGSDAVIRGVDSFQVLYGIDTDTPRDNVPNLYLSASAIDARDAALPPAERAMRPTWRRVTSVRIALLLHGERGSRTGTRLSIYELLPGEHLDEARLPPAMQRRARRLFAATVALRNP
ncbi:pilus assembly protein PilW [Pseudoduganella eburnea]|uniref:Pilus assembly protein PilW n=1 Tax=Massilia eburnea TaxID=1776165 RepID=A0A6L6QC69_9BURK|nr:PilW family protein [Massilia eburnea]MTW09323.1 pilus assembly protein PilW [Massilia eburnea]